MRPPASSLSCSLYDLVRFNSAGFWRGGVQYQQLCEHTTPSIGYWEFLNVYQEDSWTPLIDIVSNESVQRVGTFEHVTVIGYMLSLIHI